MDDWNWPKAITTIFFFIFIGFMATTYSQCVIKSQEISKDLQEKQMQESVK